MAMVNEIRQVTTDHMKKTIEHLSTELSHIRTGRASAALLDTIKVDYYGTPSPLKHIAAISVPDSKTILVQPYQPNMLQPIDKALRQSELGHNPNNDGHSLRIPIPQLTEERRKEIIKVVRKLGEDTRVAIRNIRRDSIDKLRTAQKNSSITEDELHKSEKEMQDLTDKYISEIDSIVAVKEKEIMTV
jgi:ribosome recycling factor